MGEIYFDIIFYHCINFKIIISYHYYYVAFIMCYQQDWCTSLIWKPGHKYSSRITGFMSHLKCL